MISCTNCSKSTEPLPENIINLVKCLYDNFILKLRIGDETREIPYGKGVKQGDVMASILHLFLMLAFSETLEEEYEEWGCTMHEDEGRKGVIDVL
jgi:hypothetical protein